MQSFKVPLDGTGHPVEIGQLSLGLIRSIGGVSQVKQLPPNAEVVSLVAGSSCAFKFGDSSVTCSATDGGFDGILLADERLSVLVPAEATHIAVISIATAGSLFVSKIN